MGSDLMRTIVIASRKGDSAKSMLARHLAVDAERAKGGKIALVDVDPMLHRELRAAAFQANTTIQDLILQASKKDGCKAARPDRQ